MLEHVDFRWVVRDGERILQYRTQEAAPDNAPYWKSGRDSGWVDVQEVEE